MTDWIMIGITALYAVFTLFILIANNKASNAATNALAVSKEQYEETKRLDVMPFLQIEYNRECVKYTYDLMVPVQKDFNLSVILGNTVKIKNIGKAAATNMSYEWDFETVNKKDRFQINGIMQGDEYGFRVEITGLESEFIGGTGTLTIHYTDILGNKYSQLFTLKYTGSELASVTTDIPRYIRL